jgi:hypothetical protein
VVVVFVVVSFIIISMSTMRSFSCPEKKEKKIAEEKKKFPFFFR